MPGLELRVSTSANHPMHLGPEHSQAAKCHLTRLAGKAVIGKSINRIRRIIIVTATIIYRYRCIYIYIYI